MKAELKALNFDIVTTILNNRDDTGCDVGLGVISNVEIGLAAVEILKLIETRFTLTPR